MSKSRRRAEVGKTGPDKAHQARQADNAQDAQQAPDAVEAAEAPADPSSSAPASFENALEQLEGTVARLEQGEMPLEEALELFESGVKLSRQCSRTLAEAEHRIEILLSDRAGDAEPGVGRFEFADHANGLQNDPNDEDVEG